MDQQNTMDRRQKLQSEACCEDKFPKKMKLHSILRQQLDQKIHIISVVRSNRMIIAQTYTLQQELLIQVDTTK